jgi:hypothetical protein
MTILDPAPTPRHRPLYPGELAIGLRKRPDTASFPAGATIRLLHADGTTGTWMPGGPGISTLIAQGTPVMIHAGNPAPGGGIVLAGRPGLGALTGAALAGELLGHLRALQARLGPQDTQATRTLRFRDLTRFNDLICGLAARYLGLPYTEALLPLTADLSQRYEPQRDWYASHGPDDGETLAEYRAEAAASASLASAWLRTARTQLALAGHAGTRS